MGIIDDSGKHRTNIEKWKEKKLLNTLIAFTAAINCSTQQCGKMFGCLHCWM